MARRAILRLEQGARIAIIGGGPAGTFFAHFARKLAIAQALDVEITIYDGKSFARQGPVGCNMCAGVIATPLAARLEHLGFSLPEGRVQRRIEGYYLQSAAGGFPIDHPDGKRTIRTVFRGNGPRFTEGGGNVSFDDFLLTTVQSEGVSMVSSPVHDICLPPRRGDPIRITMGGVEKQELEADLVVGAFGLNTALLDKVQGLAFGYKPPRTHRVAQAELKVGREWIERALQNRIVVLPIDVGGVTLGVLTPKSEHLTLTLMGKGDVKIGDLKAFLAHPAVRELLPPDWQLPDLYCHCFPRLAATAAQHPFTDRLVLIGDASFSRYYKNGIESAFVTAQLAANSAFHLGVSAECFRDGYLKPAQQLIVRDNFFGRLLFGVPNLLLRNASLEEAQRRVVGAEKPGYTALALRRALWNIFTGDVPYRSIVWQIANPRLTVRIGLAAMLIFCARLLRKTVALANKRRRPLT